MVCGLARRSLSSLSARKELHPAVAAGALFDWVDKVEAELARPR
jgi:hypothetical protein